MKKGLLILLAYTLLVILWGAWVRISHSGDGCGDSWPLCQGQLLPDGTEKKTWVEYSHRLMSGVFGIWILALWWKSRSLPRGDLSRKITNGLAFFTITEALLGAKLVLFGLVGMNASWGRTLSMSLHQVNSLFLTAFAAWLAFEAGVFAPAKATAPRPPRRDRWLPWSLLAFLIVAVTGAWAALAGTLFPSESLREGLLKDFASDAHHLLRLRLLHPLAAVLGAGGFSVFLWVKSSEGGPSSRLHRETALIFAGTVLFGLLTLLMLSPSWMKIAHLALAQLSWIALLRWFRFKT